MLNHRPYIIEKPNTAECGCYLNPKMTLLCPSCWTVHKIITNGCMTAESDTAEMLDIEIAPTVYIKCACGYYGAVQFMDERIAAPISELCKAGFNLRQITAGDDAQNNFFAEIVFSEKYNFKTVPMGWVMSGQTLSCKGEDAALVENLTVWVKDVTRK